MAAETPRTDIDIAKLMSKNLLPSPFPFYNATLIKVKVSGTGTAYRRKLDEYVYRDPKIFLSKELCDRVCGVPLVAEHPNTTALTADSFYTSILGVLIFGFPENGDLKAIAKVYDQRVVEMLVAGEFDTSPGIIDPGGVLVKVNDQDVLFEREPAILDHVAVVSTVHGNAGVWNLARGRGAGVEISTTETEGN